MNRHQMTLLSVTATGLLLSGCISPQEMVLRHRAACESYGFTPGTEAYSNCLLRLDMGDYGYSHHGRQRAGRYAPLEEPLPPASPEP
jgi:hypothetical protein